MKPLLLLLTAFLSSTLCIAQLTIEHCQEKARLNYPLIEQYALIDKSTEYTISNANKAYLPQVSVTGIGAYIISGLPTLSLPGAEPASSDKAKFIGIGQVNQVIWDGGATGAQKKVIAASGEVEKANIDVSLHQIRQRVDQLFFGILVTDAQLAQLDIASAALQRNLDKLQLSKDNGLAMQSDVDEVRAELLSLGQRKIEFNYTRSGYLDMLSLMIGETLEKTIVLVLPATSTTTSMPNQRPELSLFKDQRTLATAQHDMEKTSLMPKVGLLGAGVMIAPPVGFGTSDLSSLALAGISLSWNTAGLYRNGNNNKLHELKMAQIANQEKTFLFNNGLELHQDNAEIEKAKAVLAADEEIVTLKKKIKDAYQLKYDNGMCSMDELINAITKESEAESNKALHEVQLALSQHSYATDNGN
ncbi:MAG: TolC family protein [Flavobacteriales bacterium]|jgi:outer membrane protein TolC|nr:TolC family protein [Flavobacteriales bacterium]